jgi:murein DD-endopeptidase MepM/ murein hydrolase activator NlpD
MSSARAVLLLATALLLGAVAAAQTLYKYRGDDGEWIYSDRPPDDGDIEETRDIASGDANGALDIEHASVGRSVQIVAHNKFHAPLEVEIEFSQISGVAYPHPDQSLRWVLPPRSDTVLLSLPLLDAIESPEVRYETRATIGDPDARHVPTALYRVPFALARDFQITQAYPAAQTHNTMDSVYAVDLSMPIGTDIFAARGGTVIDVTGTNFRGGLDRERDAPAANVVRILHDDGTYAVYAHLNWNSIRVRAGEKVERGEYIADSGNTGYSSGPHLHFAVIRNAGMQSVSVPVRFEGANSSTVVPATGNSLTAY